MSVLAASISEAVATGRRTFWVNNLTATEFAHIEPCMESQTAKICFEFLARIS
jgi:hypothetical protein